MLLLGVPTLVLVVLDRCSGNGTVTSLVHALCVSTLALGALLGRGEDTPARAGSPSPVGPPLPLDHGAVHAVRPRGARADPGYALHHALAVATGAYLLAGDRYMTLVLWLECNEVSTIFLNLMHLGIAPQLNRVLFVLSFVACRTVWNSWILWTSSPLDDAVVQGVLVLSFS